MSQPNHSSSKKDVSKRDRRQKKGYSLQEWTQYAAQETEHLLYHDLMENEQCGRLIKESSKNLHIFRNLKSIIQPAGAKGDLLRQVTYLQPAVLVVDQTHPLDAAHTVSDQGYSPLVMCATRTNQFNQRCKEGRLDQEDQLAIRTSALYPLRSIKYRNIVKSFLTNPLGKSVDRQCLSVFLPNVMLFRGSHQLQWASDVKSQDKQRFPVWDWNQCHFLNVGLISGSSTISGGSTISGSNTTDGANTANGANTTNETKADIRNKVIKGKLNCLFDMALERRGTQKGYLDALVFTDLYCDTPELVEAYVQAADNLLQSYMHHFRLIVFAINRNDRLLEALRSHFSGSSTSPEPRDQPEASEADVSLKSDSPP